METKFLKNKIVLVTGAGKGIGFDLAKKLNQNNVKTYCVVRSSKDLKKFKNFKNCYLNKGDITNIADIRKIFKKAKKNKHNINCLVNNAGQRQRIKFEDLSEKKLKNIFEINFFAQFNCIKEFVKHFNNKDVGSIVNIGSIVGQVGFSELAGYASTKTALLGLNRCLSLELIKKNIRCNIINPGFIKTSYFNKFKRKKKLYNWTLNKIPLGRWGDSAEISELVCFLLSDKSSYINGESINIDGGWLSS
jgi:NAD(P)-dependent dehydrogenase (short-subunit alcohol dehydrogenase family)